MSIPTTPHPTTLHPGRVRGSHQHRLAACAERRAMAAAPGASPRRQVAARTETPDFKELKWGASNVAERQTRAGLSMPRGGHTHPLT